MVFWMTVSRIYLGGLGLQGGRRAADGDQGGDSVNWLSEINAVWARSRWNSARKDPLGSVTRLCPSDCGSCTALSAHGVQEMELPRPPARLVEDDRQSTLKGRITCRTAGGEGDLNGRLRRSADLT